MGCFLSCFCRSSSTFTTIRLVHLNGYVEEFEHPVSVSQIIGNSKPPKHFVFTAAQLLSTGFRPLTPNTQLQQGFIYFLLPRSALQADVSPADLASLVKKLTAKAKSARTSITSPCSSSCNGTSSVGNSSPARSPGRFVETETKVIASCKRSRARPWKPILDTIREISFTRRSESDLREMHSITAKINSI